MVVDYKCNCHGEAKSNTNQNTQTRCISVAVATSDIEAKAGLRNDHTYVNTELPAHEPVPTTSDSPQKSHLQNTPIIVDENVEESSDCGNNDGIDDSDSDYIPSPDSEKDSSSDEEDMGADSDNTCPALVDDVIYVPSSN